MQEFAVLALGAAVPLGAWKLYKSGHLRASTMRPVKTFVSDSPPPKLRNLAREIAKQARPYFDNSLTSSDAVAPAHLRVHASPDITRLLRRGLDQVCQAVIEDLKPRGASDTLRLQLVPDQRVEAASVSVYPVFAAEETNANVSSGGQRPAASTSRGTFAGALLENLVTGELHTVKVGSPLSVGRGEWNDVVLPAGDTTASRAGLSFEVTAAALMVTVDPASSTPAVVEGASVSPGQARALTGNGVFSLGKSEFCATAKLAQAVS